MYSEWLMAGLEFPSGSLREHLVRAGELVPAELLSGSGQREELAEVVADGQNHFWMDTLHYVGVWAEANGHDEKLPVEFWLRVASAADAMEFPEFVPYCLGKARRLPAQDPGDVVAAISTLPAVVDVDDQVRTTCVAIAGLVRAHDAGTAAMIETVDLDGIANHLRGGAYDAIGPEVSPLLSDGFDELFGVAARKDFPAEHGRHAWAIIGANPFKVAVGAGLYPHTYAEVWWR